MIKGRLFFHPNSPGTQEVSLVHLQRPPTRISRKIALGTRLHEFQCLQFRLFTTFTQVLRPILLCWDNEGYELIIYLGLEDLLLLHPDPKKLANLFLELCQLLTNLEFLIQKEKCSTAPVQSLVFLDALINSLTMTFAVPLTMLPVRSTSLEEEENMCIQELSAILGRMTRMSTIGVGSAPFHYRSCKNSTSSRSKGTEY